METTKYSKKIKRSSELLWLLGMLFVTFGVALCSKTDLGVSMIVAPSFIAHEFLVQFFPSLTIGAAQYIFQGFILIVMMLAVRRFNVRYLLSFAVAVIYGFLLDLHLLFLSPVVLDTLFSRWIVLILGDIAVAFGVACFFLTYLPLQVFELFVAEVSHRYNFSITRVKLIFDYSLLALSLIMAFTLFGGIGDFDFLTIYKNDFHFIGLGTVVTTIINSPLIALMSKFVNAAFEPSPLFPKLERVMKIR